MPAYLRKRDVNWGDCDAFGIVFYPHFMAWCDETFHQMAAAHGFGQRYLPERGIAGTPLRDIGARFHAPASYGDVLTIAANVSDLGRASFRMNYRISRDETLIAQTHELRMFTAWQGDVLKSVPIPDDIRTKLEGLQA